MHPGVQNTNWQWSAIWSRVEKDNGSHPGRPVDGAVHRPRVARQQPGRRRHQAGLARQVATQLSGHDAIGVHAREELGLTETTMARPVQAGVSSAAAVAVAVVPVLVLLVSPPPARAAAIVAVAPIALGLIGRLAAAVRGADRRRATARVVAGGALAMAVTAAVGRLAGVAGI
jgi:vacuolar iron transporter family protein